MEYQYNQTAQSAQAAAKQQAISQGYSDCVPVTPHFEGLPSVAERAELAADRIQRFIDRFNGGPSNPAAGTQLGAIPSGHLGQLRRFGLAVEQFERLATELDAIG